MEELKKKGVVLQSWTFVQVHAHVISCISVPLTTAGAASPLEKKVPMAKTVEIFNIMFTSKLRYLLTNKK